MSELEERIAAYNAKETEKAQKIWDATGFHIGQIVLVKKAGHTYNGRVGTITDYTVWKGKVVRIEVDMGDGIAHCKLSSLEKV